MSKLKRIILITLIGLLFSNLGFAQEDSIILEIRRDFQKWQPIIEREFDSCTRYYNYAWGENFQYDKWFNEIQDNDGLATEKIVSIIEKEDLGYFVYIDYYSFSGDWYIAVDHYYNVEEQLYFIFWAMNTFYAEESVSVEKRLYFNYEGELIHELQSVYKMNTKEKIDIDFMDIEVEYELNLSDMDFYKSWSNEE